MNVFNGYRSFIHKDTNSESKSAKRHDVDGLPCKKKERYTSEQSQRNSQHDDQCASSITQE